MKFTSELNHRTSKGYGYLITAVLTFISVFMMWAGCASCTVTKQKHFEHKKSDTSSSWDERVQEVLNSHELVDSSIYTDADTLMGEVYLSDSNGRIIESDNQKIELTGVAGTIGRIKIKVTSKPKKVDFKVNKSTTKITNSNKTGETKASHNDKVVVKEKKTTYKWYVYVIPVVIILLALWWVVSWVRKQRNLTKEITGV